MLSPIFVNVPAFAYLHPSIAIFFAIVQDEKEMNIDKELIWWNEFYLAIKEFDLDDDGENKLNWSIFA